MKKTALWIIFALVVAAFIAVYTMQTEETVVVNTPAVVNNAIDDAQDTVQDVEQDTEQLADDVEDVIQGIIDEVEAEINEGAEAVEEAVDQTGDEIQEATDNDDTSDVDADEEDTTDSDEDAGDVEEDMNDEDDTTEVVVANEGFVEYTPEAVDTALTADQNVVLFFHAGRCPSCLALESDIQENMTDIDENTTIIKVDYDTQEELKAQYGVTAQHTLVYLDENGDEIMKERASATVADVNANVN